MMNATLVLLHKKPQLRIGKQRLAVRFGTELTFQIAKALLACAVEDASVWPGTVVLAPAKADDSNWTQKLADSLSQQCMVVPQTEGNLGQRLNALDHELRNRGMKQLVYIGSDSPSLNIADYNAVRETLSGYDVALMPATDGGVVLMANRIAWPDLSALPWSTAQLGSALTKKCQMHNQSVRILRENYDIDEPQDFLALVNRLAGDNRPARRALHALACDVASALNTGKGTLHG